SFSLGAASCAVGRSGATDRGRAVALANASSGVGGTGAVIAVTAALPGTTVGASAVNAIAGSGGAPLFNDCCSGSFAEITGTVWGAAKSTATGWINATAATAPIQAKQNEMPAATFSLPRLSPQIRLERSGSGSDAV